MKKVLVVAAHPDDELLGVGGTIRKLANEGVECRAVIIGEGLTSRADKRASSSFVPLVAHFKSGKSMAISFPGS